MTERKDSRSGGSWRDDRAWQAGILIGSLVARAILIPAHTSGHIAYYFAAEKAVFTGDTLFAGGCGRLFARG